MRWLLFVVVTVATSAILSFLYIYDGKGPWPTIITMIVAYANFLLWLLHERDNYPKKKNRDWHLSTFLSTQLSLALLSKYDHAKGPHGDGPLSAADAVLDVHPELRIGVTELVFGSDMQAEAVARVLMCIVYLCISAWSVAIVCSLYYSKEQVLKSWWRRINFVLLCCSYIFLHGIMASINGVSHRFYVPMYSFLSLMLEITLDINSHPLLCLFDGFTFWSAGISKLRNSNGTWHTGRALCRHVRFDYDNDWLQRQFCQILAPASLSFEIIAPMLMLFGDMGTLAFVLFAISFHLGIAVLMFPRYTPQSFAYILLFRYRKDSGGTKFRVTRTRIVYGLAIPVLLATTVWRLEIWPLTAVPMYSTDIPDKFGSTLQEAIQAAQIVDSAQCISDFKGRGSNYVHIGIIENTEVDEKPPNPEQSSSGKKKRRRRRRNNKCRSDDALLYKLGPSKLIKYILLRGVARSLRQLKTETHDNCDSLSSSNNPWLDKYARAIYNSYCDNEHNKVNAKEIVFSLRQQKQQQSYHNVKDFNEKLIPVYTYRLSDSNGGGAHQKQNAFVKPTTTTMENQPPEEQQSSISVKEDL